jgi:hypothetical protein
MAEIGDGEYGMTQADIQAGKFRLDRFMQEAEKLSLKTLHETHVNRTTCHLLVNRCHTHEMRKRGLKNPPAEVNMAKAKVMMVQFRLV